MKVCCMKFVNHRLGVWITFRPHYMRSNYIWFPVKPILYNYINRYFIVTVIVFHTQNFCLTFVPVLRLEQSECPLTIHWGLPGCYAISRYNFIEIRTIHEIIVNFIATFRYVFVFGVSSFGSVKV